MRFATGWPNCAGSSRRADSPSASQPLAEAVDELVQVTESTSQLQATDLSHSRSLFEDPRLVDDLVDESITEIAGSLLADRDDEYRSAWEDLI